MRHIKDEGGYESVSGYYYNSIETIKDKTTLAAQSAGGVMIWALNADTTGSTSLLNAIHQVAPVLESTASPTVTTVSLISGTVGSTYGPVALAATGGTTPYAWSIVAGSLPAGLTMVQGHGRHQRCPDRLGNVQRRCPMH